MASGGWHNIVVCCDGTWCGAETGTRTNIQILADAFATSDLSNPVYLKDNEPKYNPKTNTDVVYFNGVGTSGIEKPTPGLMGGFLDLLVYCANGIVARDLDERCKEAYRFIKDHYKGPDKSRIWLFGLSRGAYTVRAVAGMINNCGIINKDYKGDPKDHLEPADVQEALVQLVWNIYSSNEEHCKPNGSASENLRNEDGRVWPVGKTPPIVFMGLLDTVGAVGVPRIDLVGVKPVTYDYVPMRDFAVSSEVQHVFQACSTHDRLTPFEPCFVRRKEQYMPSCSKDDTGTSTVKGQYKDRAYKVDYATEEVWYPGAHYDLGRQDFVFGNQPIINAVNETVNMLRTNVNCLPELADYPLVGYDLKTPYPYPTDTGTFPPCIVGRVCGIDRDMLRPPSDTKAWQALVTGPETQRADSVLTWGAKIMRVIGKSVGGLLPPPLQPFQPAYTIDAEPDILETLAKVVGLGLHGAWDEGVVLKDRAIPLPGTDKWGFKIGTAKFFPVPSDRDRTPPNTHNSYKPDGRKPERWFMSKTYDNYQKALAVWKVSGRVLVAAAPEPVAAAAPGAAVVGAAAGKGLQRPGASAGRVVGQGSTTEVSEPASGLSRADKLLQQQQQQLSEDRLLLQQLVDEGYGLLQVQLEDATTDKQGDLVSLLAEYKYYLLRKSPNGLTFATVASLEALQLDPNYFQQARRRPASTAGPSAAAVRPGGSSSQALSQTTGLAGSPAGSSAGPHSGVSSSSSAAQPAVIVAQGGGSATACAVAQLGEPPTAKPSVRRTQACHMACWPVSLKALADKECFGLTFVGVDGDVRATIKATLHVCLKPAAAASGKGEVCIKIHSLKGTVTEQPGAPTGSQTAVQRPLVGIHRLHLTLAATADGAPIELKGDVHKGALQQLYGVVDTKGGWRVGGATAELGISVPPSLNVGVQLEHQQQQPAEPAKVFTILESVEPSYSVLDDSSEDVWTISTMLKRNIVHTLLCQQAFDLDTISTPSALVYLIKGGVAPLGPGDTVPDIQLMLGAELAWGDFEPGKPSMMKSLQALLKPAKAACSHVLTDSAKSGLCGCTGRTGEC